MKRHALALLLTLMGCGGADAPADAATRLDALSVDAPDGAADGGADAFSMRAGRYEEWRLAGLGSFTNDHVTLSAEGARLSGALAGSDANGAFFYGEIVSPEVEVEQPFLEIVPSWNAETPPGTWVEVRVRARVSGTWTSEYVLGVWASGTERFARHSVDGQDDANGAVLTDTLRLSASADAYQLRVRLASSSESVSPTLWAVGASTYDRNATRPMLARETRAYGMPLDVPTRSQMIYPDGGEVWCSPTSTSMVLAYWSRVRSLPTLTQPVPTVAAGTYDSVYDGTGNWPFNTAYAASLSGGSLRAFVTRLARLEQLERLTAAGIPVVISISFAAGTLTGGPISSTTGHLIVVRGFDMDGNVLVNDPAGPDDARVRFTYMRDQLDAAWAHSGRTAYVIHPVDLPLPTEGALGAW